jgi:ankyrin repeat protein
VGARRDRAAFSRGEGFEDAARFLAERGADVNAVNELGDSRLIDVAILGHTAIAEILL